MGCRMVPATANYDEERRVGGPIFSTALQCIAVGWLRLKLRWLWLGLVVRSDARMC